jgi:hypothetical protein
MVYLTLLIACAPADAPAPGAAPACIDASSAGVLSLHLAALQAARANVGGRAAARVAIGLYVVPGYTGSTGSSLPLEEGCARATGPSGTTCDDAACWTVRCADDGGWRAEGSADTAATDGWSVTPTRLSTRWSPEHPELLGFGLRSEAFDREGRDWSAMVYGTVTEGALAVQVSLPSLLEAPLQVRWTEADGVGSGDIDDGTQVIAEIDGIGLRGVGACE